MRIKECFQYIRILIHSWKRGMAIKPGQIQRRQRSKQVLSWTSAACTIFSFLLICSVWNTYLTILIAYVTVSLYWGKTTSKRSKRCLSPLFLFWLFDFSFFFLGGIKAATQASVLCTVKTKKRFWGRHNLHYALLALLNWKENHLNFSIISPYKYSKRAIY